MGLGGFGGHIKPKDESALDIVWRHASGSTSNGAILCFIVEMMEPDAVGSKVHTKTHTLTSTHVNTLRARLGNLDVIHQFDSEKLIWLIIGVLLSITRYQIENQFQSSTLYHGCLTHIITILPHTKNKSSSG